MRVHTVVVTVTTVLHLCTMVVKLGDTGCRRKNTNLLAELGQDTGLDVVRPLHRPRGGEGPAAAA